VSEVAKTATYTRAYAKSNGFLTLLSDGERLTGAYALGPEASEWLQQATLAIRARVPLEVLRDTIVSVATAASTFLLIDSTCGDDEVMTDLLSEDLAGCGS
jgi:pyruvate/2-oxoglutarate dehydrogenase complex dihydrolipoamide dehydrogenase (E3) component